MPWTAKKSEALESRKAGRSLEFGSFNFSIIWESPDSSVPPASNKLMILDYLNVRSDHQF